MNTRLDMNGRLPQKLLANLESLKPPPIPPAAISAADADALAARRTVSDQELMALVAAPNLNPGLNLIGMNLSEAQLPGIFLNRPYLNETLLPRANLTGATLTGSYPNGSLHEIDQPNFSGATMRQMKFDRLGVQAGQFYWADFGYADLAASTEWAFCTFDYTSWLGTLFRGTSIVGGVTFHYSSFQHAIFHNASAVLDDPARPVVFNVCDFTAAMFVTCSFQSVVFNHCKFGQATFKGTDLSGAVFDGCELENAAFREVNSHYTVRE